MTTTRIVWMLGAALFLTNWSGRPHRAAAETRPDGHSLEQVRQAFGAEAPPLVQFAAVVTGATISIPSWEVATNGTVGGDIPAGARDTLVEISNPSTESVLAKFEIWTRADLPILGFMVPLRAGDLVSLSMRQILNGNLNVNPATQATGLPDACASPTWYRFQNPNATDRMNSVSIYAVPAFSGSFRRNVWDALDDSPDGSGGTGGDGVYAGSFRGSLTVDVVNYCTNYHPGTTDYFVNDAIATRRPGAASPNLLAATAVYSDQSGTWPAVADVVTFDSALDWSTESTFYGRFYTGNDLGSTPTAVPVDFRFRGDGRRVPGPSATSLHVVPPCRVVNTRRADFPAGLGAPSVGAAGSADRDFPLTSGSCGIPSTAVAVALNVTVADTQGAGYLTLYPGDGTAPATSTINFALGQVKANNVFLPLAADGSGTIKVKSGSTGALNLLIDVVGYFE